MPAKKKATKTASKDAEPEPAPAAPAIEENATLVQPANDWEAPKLMIKPPDQVDGLTEKALDEDINCFIDASGAWPPARPRDAAAAARCRHAAAARCRALCPPPPAAR